MIGAGVIGLTTAVTLAEHGYRVQVRTAELPEHTTSWTAGALWGPWFVQPAERAWRWAAESLRVLTEQAGQLGTGVRLVSGMEASLTEHEPPQWLSLLPEARPCHAGELPDGYRYGVRYTAPLVTMPVHLPYLVNRLREAGGALELGTVASLDEALGRAPIVVNCTGVGARALVDDLCVTPVRGQHVIVSNPGITEFVEVDTGNSTDLVAIYPHGDHVVLGGTAEPNVWDRAPDLAEADAIVARCAAVVPSLRGAAVLAHRVGLRPSRPEVRLEVEAGSDGARIVHNYGHGGAGVSLAWGCAREVLALLGR